MNQINLVLHLSLKLYGGRYAPLAVYSHSGDSNALQTFSFIVTLSCGEREDPFAHTTTIIENCQGDKARILGAWLPLVYTVYSPLLHKMRRFKIKAQTPK